MRRAKKDMRERTTLAAAAHRGERRAAHHTEVGMDMVDRKWATEDRSLEQCHLKGWWVEDILSKDSKVRVEADATTSTTATRDGSNCYILYFDGCI